jgi:lambda family phage minor tail protein L
VGVYADVQQLEAGALVDLFEIDLTAIGGDVLRFHGYTQVGEITWQSNAFDPWPIKSTGFELSGDGRPASPSLEVGNLGGTIGALAMALDDLVGSKLTRHRTFGKYLDAVNFGGVNPTANPAEYLRPEVWYIEQRSRETPEVVEFLLSSPLDMNGQVLPGRQILANMCGWLKHGGYRGPYCGYTGILYFNRQDEPVGDPALDQCGGRVSSCKLRFGADAELPYGGMPAADGARGY